ncbi:MAG: alkaline phosphatase family protein [Opitutia bacterium Tous-C1TDCM]|nr:MAG: alkaline phosphatase family protein [Opitutae bacterium Tous-C1TDCM]
MAERTAILNVVGLTSRLIGPDTPRLRRAAEQGGLIRVRPVLPAVTCTAQSTYLTGLSPSGHGAVANGWYDRTLAEHQFWKQSNRVVAGRKLWETCRAARPGFTCAKLFWWYNMYSSADWAITPRPMYPADGRKVFDVYTQPMGLREEIKADLGPFPFPAFWGPTAGIASSEWIARSAEWIEERHRPDLSLVYLPHLDYNLQRLGPDDPRLAADLRAIDDVAGGLLDFYARRGVKTAVLSEYGITAVRRTVALNRIFRAKGWITVKEELGLELLDCGASQAFAIADHQIAHIYVNDPALLGAVRAAVEAADGVARVLGGTEMAAAGLAHERSGDLVALAAEDAWFTYYYWEDDRKAPDFARCVDIHRKYGYDPVELFVDPALALPKLRIAAKLLRKKLGFRILMDVIPLDASLVKGSHGICPADAAEWPVLIGTGASAEAIPATAVHDRLLGFCLRK